MKRLKQQKKNSIGQVLIESWYLFSDGFGFVNLKLISIWLSQNFQPTFQPNKVGDLIGAFAMHLTCVMNDSFEDLCQFRLYKITALGKLAIYNLKTVLALPFKHFRNGQKLNAKHLMRIQTGGENKPFLWGIPEALDEKKDADAELSNHYLCTLAWKIFPLVSCRQKTLSKGSVHWSQFNGNLRFYMWAAVERKWGGGGVLYG